MLNVNVNVREPQIVHPLLGGAAGLKHFESSNGVGKNIQRIKSKNEHNI